MQTAPLRRAATRLELRALLAPVLSSIWEAKDRARYEGMSEAELAVHDLDRKAVEDRLRRRYRRGGSVKR